MIAYFGAVGLQGLVRFWRRTDEKSWISLGARHAAIDVLAFRDASQSVRRIGRAVKHCGSQ